MKITKANALMRKIINARLTKAEIQAVVLKHEEIINKRK